MKHRIVAILDKLQLSPSKFADELGIQRSGMSHILSGRNNPSLDLIQKILNRYPDVNIDYLIQGKGPVLVTEKVPEQEVVPVITVNSKPVESVVTVMEEPPMVVSSNPITKLEPRPQLALFDISPAPQPTKTPQQLMEEKSQAAKKTESVVPKDTLTTPKPATTIEKKIKRIVIFYEDHTFSAYTPEA